jgi:hypothetical protein
VNGSGLDAVLEIALELPTSNLLLNILVPAQWHSSQIIIISGKTKQLNSNHSLVFVPHYHVSLSHEEKKIIMYFGTWD